MLLSQSSGSWGSRDLLNRTSWARGGKILCVFMTPALVIEAGHRVKPREAPRTGRQVTVQYSTCAGDCSPSWSPGSMLVRHDTVWANLLSDYERVEEVRTALSGTPPSVQSVQSMYDAVRRRQYCAVRRQPLQPLQSQGCAVRNRNPSDHVHDTVCNVAHLTTSL